MRQAGVRLELPRRSALERAIQSGAFWWAAGIEDTFITTPHPVTGRTLDEYELTGHYDHWRTDIDLMAGLGLQAARYGIPWHRIQPAPDRWDWSHADGPIEHLLASGISPQIDLVHYGLPGWIADGFHNSDYPKYVADFAARVAERYRGRVFWYTPLNEPRITAWYCGRLGWWPPFGRSLGGFVRVMLSVCRGIVATVAALKSVDPEIVDYHVDATDVFTAGHPDLAGEAELRQRLVFLALDLVSGRIDEAHPLRPWLVRNGATEAELDAFVQSAIRPTVIGLNLYPIFTLKRLDRDTKGRLRIRMPYAEPNLVDQLATLYWERYRVPLTVSETATKGSVARRIAWLDGSIASCRAARARGIPMIGYTWWPLFSLVAWAWRQGRGPVTKHLLDMGLWDLDPRPDRNLERLRTPVADHFARIVAEGTETVGTLSAAA